MNITEQDLQSNPKLAALVKKAEHKESQKLPVIPLSMLPSIKFFKSGYNEPMTEIQELYIFDITPIGKPRMTRRDKIAKLRTAQAAKYMVFRNQLQQLMREQDFTIGEGIEVIFLLPYKKNWTMQKCIEMRGKPHQEKPDADNMLKAFIDVAAKNDQAIYDKSCQKYWYHRGLIVVVRNSAKYKHLTDNPAVYSTLGRLENKKMSITSSHFEAKTGKEGKYGQEE